MTNQTLPRPLASITRRHAEPEPVLKVVDVAAYLQCDRNSVYRLVREGQLRAINIGRTLRIPASALDAFIAGERPDVD